MIFKQQRRFYCYALMDPRKPGPYAYGRYVFPFEPFYIGKGTGYRIHAHFTEAKRYMKEGIPVDAEEMAKVDRLIEIFNLGIDPESMKIVEGLNEFESFEHETELIGLIGRVAKNAGPLVNENDGTQFIGPQPIKFTGMKGMDNVNYAENDTSLPRTILNADVTGTGRLVKRSGYMKKIHLPGAHSLWSCPLGIFVAANNTIYRIRDHETLLPISPYLGPPDERIHYTTDGVHVFMSNRHWMGKYNPSFGVMVPYAFDLPPLPILVPNGGDIPAGEYKVCLTAEASGIQTAPGPWVHLSLPNGGGFTVVNRENCRVWMTDVDGSTFYDCGISDHVASLNTMSPLLTVGTVPVFPLEHIKISFGRLWGSRGNELHYSEPYRYDLIRLTSFIPYSEEICMIAPVSTQGGAGGLYVGFKSRTIFLTGSSPDAMSERTVGAGVVTGTLAYCDHVPDLGNNIPAWMGTDGCYIGDAFGNVRNISAERIKVTPGASGSSVFQMKDGVPQLLSTVKKGDSTRVGFGDDATCEVIRNGQVL